MKNLIKKIFSDRRVRFLFVGVLNTIVGYGCFAGAIFFGLHYVAAQAVASVFAILHSYLWNKYFTFKVKKRSLKEFGRFVLVYFLSYLINLILLFLIVTEHLIFDGFQKHKLKS